MGVSRSVENRVILADQADSMLVLVRADEKQVGLVSAGWCDTGLPQILGETIWSVRVCQESGRRDPALLSSICRASDLHRAGLASSYLQQNVGATSWFD